MKIFLAFFLLIQQTSSLHVYSRGEGKFFNVTSPTDPPDPLPLNLEESVIINSTSKIGVADIISYMSNPSAPPASQLPTQVPSEVVPRRYVKTFMQMCLADNECDNGKTTLLRCEVNMCKCPIGRIEPELGGIVLNSEWSPALKRCEARGGSECNAGGGGITCINGQGCNQLMDRPTGIGCCGYGCNDAAKSTPTSLLTNLLTIALYLVRFLLR